MGIVGSLHDSVGIAKDGEADIAPNMDTIQQNWGYELAHMRFAQIDSRNCTAPTRIAQKEEKYNTDF